MNISKLQLIVNESKLSKVQIAEKCGFTRVTLDKILQGADAKISTIESLAKVLGVSLGDLFDEQAPIPSQKAVEKEEVRSPMGDQPVGDEIRIPLSAWTVIERQAKSLDARDRQIDDLIALLKEQRSDSKKTMEAQAV